MRVRTIFRLWLPLAISFELMMLEGPAIQGAMGRTPNPALQLAAWGITIGLAMIIESPVIMLLSTAIALVKNAATFYALRRFMLALCLFCTLLTGLVAFTPLFPLIAGRLMGIDAPIVAAAQPALQIMLFWTAVIAWRRFFQGIMVRCGQTRFVSWGTAIRLSVAVGTAAALVIGSHLSGVQIGAITIMAAVTAEAIATTIFALPIVRREVLSDLTPETLTQREIFQFHAPLAATTLLTLLALPMTSAALARLPHSEQTLAAWNVAFMALLVIRGWGLALQESTVSQARNPEARPALRRFAWMVGGVTSAAALLFVAAPLHTVYFHAVLQLPTDLDSYVLVGIGAGLLTPLLTALSAWARGLLVADGATQAVYRGMAVNLATHGGLLVLGVVCRLPGMWVAAGAFTFASFAEYLFLIRCLPRYAAVYAPSKAMPIDSEPILIETTTVPALMGTEEL